jgi:hypothetical protein
VLNHFCNSSYGGGIDRCIIAKVSLDKNKRPYLKLLPKTKMAGTLAAEAEPLPIKCEALRSNCSTAKK